MTGIEASAGPGADSSIHHCFDSFVPQFLSPVSKYSIHLNNAGIQANVGVCRCACEGQKTAGENQFSHSPRGLQGTQVLRQGGSTLPASHSYSYFLNVELD